MTEVIDLTISDDESPTRPSKRHRGCGTSAPSSNFDDEVVIVEPKASPSVDEDTSLADGEDIKLVDAKVEVGNLCTIT